MAIQVASAPGTSPAGQQPAEFVYISGGKLFRLDADANLQAKDDPAAAPVTWPFAHEVRPARQSLGVNSCTDCHSFSSSFLFRKAQGTGNSFMRLNKPYQKLFGLSFAVRPLFKWALFLFILVIGSIVALVLLLGLGRLAGLIEKRK